jgi:hypothetical protein
MVALSAFLCVGMIRADGGQWEVIGVGFLNFYRQDARLKRILEAGARSRAGMDKVLNELDV